MLLVCLIFFIYTNIIRTRSSELIDLIDYQIEKNILPYQVSFFTNENSTLMVYKNSIFQRLMSKFPCAIINTSKVNSSVTNHLCDVATFNNPNPSVLTLIIYEAAINDQNSTLNIEKVINYIVKLSPSGIRPKCLVVLLNPLNLDLHEFLEKILKYAWSKKFLNFSIIERCANKLSFLYYFNPFYNTYKRTQLKRDVIVFPDKLTNGNRFYLNASEYHRSGLVNEDQKFDYYTKISNTMEALNFQFKRIPLQFRRMPQYCNVSMKLLQNGSSNMFSNAISHFLINSDKVEFYVTADCRKIISVVPIIYTTKLNVVYNVIAYGYLFMIFCTYFIHLMQVTILVKTSIDAFDLLQALLGMPTVHEPQRISDRIILSTAILIFLAQSNDFYSKLTNGNVLFEETAFNSFEELYKSGMNFEANQPIIEQAFFREDFYIQKIKNKTRSIFLIDDCIRKLLQNKNVICIMVQARANSFHYYDERQQLVMKIPKPTFACERIVIPFEKSSPYIEKFAMIFQRYQESGMWQTWKMKSASLRHTTNNIPNVNTTNINLTKSLELITILLVGLIAATIIFFGELVIHKFVRHKRISSRECCKLSYLFIRSLISKK